MNVIRYTPEHKNAWNTFLKQGNNASFLFHRDFMDYHQDRFDDHSLLIYEAGKLIALLPAHLEDQVLCSHFGLSYGGIIQLATLTLHQYVAMIEAIADHCQQGGIHSLVINEIPSIYNTTTTNTLAFISSALQGNPPQVQVLSTLDIAHPIHLNTNRKRMIQKGVQNGYYVQEDHTPTSFWQTILLPRLSDRYSTAPVHTLAEITYLMQAFPQSIKQMNVYTFAGELVGGTTLFVHPNVVHTQYIAGREEDNQRGALDLLFYTLIEQYKSTVRYFDFGSSHVSPKQLNPGLLYWKESFGARSIPQYCYTFSIENLLKIGAIL